MPLAATQCRRTSVRCGRGIRRNMPALCQCARHLNHQLDVDLLWISRNQIVVAQCAQDLAERVHHRDAAVGRYCLSCWMAGSSRIQQGVRCHEHALAVSHIAAVGGRVGHRLGVQDGRIFAVIVNRGVGAPALKPPDADEAVLGQTDKKRKALANAMRLQGCRKRVEGYLSRCRTLRGFLEGSMPRLRLRTCRRVGDPPVSKSKRARVGQLAS